jgi:hypothetical protein
MPAMSTRDRIWKFIDDLELEGHEALRNALYRLLVVVEGARETAAARVELCLDLAAAAIRDGSAAAIARARAVVDELVLMLATGSLELGRARLAV